MSEHHCADAVQSPTGEIRDAKETDNFRTRPELIRGRCEGNVFRQTVPDTEKGRSPTVGSRLRLTISDEEKLERSR